MYNKKTSKLSNNFKNLKIKVILTSNSKKLNHENVNLS